MQGKEDIELKPGKDSQLRHDKSAGNLQVFCSLLHHFLNYLARWLDVLDSSCTLACEENTSRSSLQRSELHTFFLLRKCQDLRELQSSDRGWAGTHKVLGIDILHEGGDAGTLHFLNLMRSLLLILHIIWCLEDPHRAASVDDCSNGVRVVRVHDPFLVERTSPCLRGGDETGADPDARAAHSQTRSEAPAIKNAASPHDHDLLTCQRRRLPSHGIHHFGKENGCGDITSVASALTTLSANDVTAHV
mmetsp:Transcript_8225/g.11926  ORF Transcript_8225/g.11926 Transcript_8225/m.11926 type:complete len:247 (+) Transcript_8225:244-984(+)